MRRLVAAGPLGGGVPGDFGGPFLLGDPGTKPPGLRLVRRRAAGSRTEGDAEDAGDGVPRGFLRRG